MKNKKVLAIIFAILAALLYGINMPFSKLLLNYVEPTMMASYLYLGAGIGIGILFLFKLRNIKKEELISINDLPYTLGMIILDIIAPILLMFGLKSSMSSSASLLNNFEIVATSIIALAIFKEKISPRMWIAIFLVTISSFFLSIEDLKSFTFSWGSALVLLATICWGFENNCTRMLSGKNTYEIVFLKGIFSGLGSLIVALILSEGFPKVEYFLLALVLGFVAYGLSIFFYIKAQGIIGAAKTSAYYAFAPFIGSFIGFLILKESLDISYYIGLAIMIVGSILIVIDTLILKHSHLHKHIISFVDDEGVERTVVIEHSHPHKHLANDKHEHKHTNDELGL